MTSIKGVIIHPGGRVTVADFDDLADYQAAVGGYIEEVSLDGATMLVDEDGRYKPDAEPNPVATQIAALLGRPMLGLVGPAVLVGPSRGDHWTSITEPCRAAVWAVADAVSGQAAS